MRKYKIRCKGKITFSKQNILDCQIRMQNASYIQEKLWDLLKWINEQFKYFLNKTIKHVLAFFDILSNWKNSYTQNFFFLSFQSAVIFFFCFNYILKKLTLNVVTAFVFVELFRCKIYKTSFLNISIFIYIF